MEKMTQDEYKAFMMTGTRTGKIATVRNDGRPHVVPVWFVLDDDDNIIFMTHHNSVKAKNITRDKRVAMSVDEEVPPFAFVLVEGTVEIMDLTPEEQLVWSTKIGGRYMGAEHAEEFGKRNAVPEEWVLRLMPNKVVAMKDLAG